MPGGRGGGGAVGEVGGLGEAGAGGPVDASPPCRITRITASSTSMSRYLVRCVVWLQH